MTAPESREAVEKPSGLDLAREDLARYVRETWALVVEREKARVERSRAAGTTCASRYVPRHSRSYVIEKWNGWSWQWHETRSSLADAIARIDAFPWFARRIVCEGVPLGEVGAGCKWFDAA